MDQILTYGAIDFIKNKMCIDPEEYISRMKKYDEHIKYVFKELVIHLLDQEQNFKDYSMHSAYIDKAYKILTNNGFNIDLVKEEFEVADIMIRAFSRYRKHGLLHLYTGAESDHWDPLPKITKSLYMEMQEWDKKEFDNFDNILMIYRGTSYLEYENPEKDYSQSWTLDKEKAKYFAFELGEAKYINTDRVIIEAKIAKENIYAYIGREKECIINPNEIINGTINIIEKKVFSSLGKRSV